MPLIECVPNFSEGRDRSVIDAIISEIDRVDGVELLDVDPGASTNRTVVTFVGESSAIGEAAFCAIVKAAELIDMRNHHGEHPRMGATDVCPFVPLGDATLQDCVALARELAARVGDAGIPVYLYEHAATTGRRSLADARKGEYEALATRPDRPDFGPNLNPASGATAIGARQFLIAYNVNLNTTDRRRAHQIAQAIRELGTPQRDQDGKLVKNKDGETVFTPGRFKECKAVGWYLEDYGRAQVSINLTDYEVTSLHDVFDACREEAAVRGMRVTGSELVGLAPKAALLAAGDHYLRQQGRTTGIPEHDRIRSAIVSLGLNELAEFDPHDKIVEYRTSTGPGPLASMPVMSLLHELSTESPAPGGGSTAALVGALASSLTSMVAALTHAKKGFEEAQPAMETLGRRAQELARWFADTVDRDTDAFNAILVAARLPKKTTAEAEDRERALAAANLQATVVPLEVLEHAVVALELALQAAREGNPNSISDAGVAALCAEAAARGASLNVRINLPGVDPSQQEELQRRHDTSLLAATDLAVQVGAVVEAGLQA